MNRYIPTGSSRFDGILGGGLQPGRITLIYGAAGTGKTTFAIQSSLNTARLGLKTLFIDSDNTFRPERLMQMASDKIGSISENIILFQPSNFDEQGLIIDHLEDYLTRSFGLIVVDTITSLYRDEIGDANRTFAMNRELNRQVARLAEISRVHRIPILITSQVRSVISEEEDIVPVATRILRFWSDNILRLKPSPWRGVVSAAFEKSRGEAIEWNLKISREGIHDYEEGNS